MAAHENGKNNAHDMVRGFGRRRQVGWCCFRNQRRHRLFENDNN